MVHGTFKVYSIAFSLQDKECLATVVEVAELGISGTKSIQVTLHSTPSAAIEPLLDVSFDVQGLRRAVL